jgi:hypothetical protein
MAKSITEQSEPPYTSEGTTPPIEKTIEQVKNEDLSTVSGEKITSEEQKTLNYIFDKGSEQLELLSNNTELSI